MKKMHGLFLFVTALALVVLQEPAEGDPRATAINITCGTQRNHNTTLSVTNFVSTMDNISSQIQSSGFGVAVTGLGPDASYGLAQCYGDLRLQDCVLCYAEARTVLPQCFPFNGGRIFLDGCFMRSENYSFFDEFAGAQDIAVCGNTSRKGSSFAEQAKQAVLRAVEAAPTNKGYARTHQVAEHESAYVLADCWKTLNESSCTACLEEASASVLGCLPWSEGRALSTGCFIRYSDTDFFNQEPTNTTPRGSSRATEAALICPNRTAKMSWDRSFVTNYMAALEAVSRLVVTQKYGAVENTTGTSQLYAYGECMKDLSRSDCDVCFAESKARIGPCLPSQQARVFLDGCYLRYDDYNFFSENLSSEDQTICGSSYFNGGNRTVFGDNVAELVRNLSIEAPKNDGFFTGSVNRGNVLVYGLAQCWETVNRSGCDLCLANAVSSVGSCPPKEDGRVLNAGCYLRYSTNKFYNSNFGNLAAGKNAGRRRLAITLAITSSAVAVGLVVAAIVLCTKKKHLKEKRERKQLCPLLSTVDKSNLKFSYQTLENATDSFHISNKLGQGGSGSVYKGILPDGKVVAVKKLFFNTGPWVDHFYNEVNLISCINHKNLVKLLGCSINGPESLLVYEFVPNQSLSDHLFVKGDAQPLSQELRYSIILGIAEGLAYLHEESNLRIIHRDIKLSNVLLEVDFTAKIADFGLARLFPEDETHISTGVAGTIGYMAPEYVVRGKLTEKADVYGFGVLVIEVVSGKRNNSFIQGSFSILQMVWSLYGKGKLTEAVDPVLKGNFQEEEVYRILQIGLLCVQASAELRPSMSTVVKMLTMNQEIPQPTEPPFLTSSSAEPAHNSLLKPTISHSSLAHLSQSSGNKMTESWIGPR